MNASSERRTQYLLNDLLSAWGVGRAQAAARRLRAITLFARWSPLTASAPHRPRHRASWTPAALCC